MPKLWFAFDKYPVEEWLVEEIFIVLDDKDAKELEVLFIEIFDTFHKGYNSCVEHVNENTRSLTRTNSRKGKPLTPEHAASVRRAAKERVMSESHREALRTLGYAKKGKPSPLKGRRQTPEHVANAKANRPRTQPFLGRVHSDETKLRMSAAQRGKEVSDDTRAKLAAAHPTSFSVKTPSGEVVEVTNMSEFCRTHNLDTGNLYNTSPNSKRRYKQHKGFSLV